MTKDNGFIRAIHPLQLRLLTTKAPSALPRALFLGCLISGIASPGFAQSANWDGSTGNWSDGTKWDTLLPPTGSEFAYVNSGSVTIDQPGAVSHLLAVGATGAVTVTGPGIASTTGELDLVGGTFTLESAGAFQADNSSLDAGIFAINGAGSTYTGDYIYLGRGIGNITMTVEAGGVLTTGNTSIGEGANTTLATNLTATVTGSGSIWNAGAFTMGGGINTTTASLTIEDGGKMTADSRSSIGTGGLGTVTVTGAGSQLLINNGGVLSLGQNFNGPPGGDHGQGNLNIEAGGLVSAHSLIVGNDTGSTGTLHLDGTAGMKGVVLVGNLVGGDGTASVEFNGGILRASGDSNTFIDNFNDGDLVIQNGGLYIDSGAFTVEARSALTGAGELDKLGAGTVILTNANIYSGGTTITDGTLQLGDGGTTGSILGNVADNGILAFNRSDVVTFTGMISGTGGVHQIGTGKTVLSNDSSGLSGTSQVQAGILSVNGILGGTMEVLGGRLQGYGQVGDTTNFAAGTIAPGNSIGTLTIAGNYVGSGGTLEIETALGDDSSATDKLIVTGDTSGSTNVHVTNFGGGTGARTNEGIKIIDVAGASNGDFTLLGNYLFEGDPAVVAGAYAYRLYQGGASTPVDGDWYLRSTFINTPLYQAGAPVYEAYAAVLQDFSRLDTLQQRVGHRAWTNGVIDNGALPGAAGDGSGIWGRITGRHASIDPQSSTTGANYDNDTWQLQAGADGQFYAGDAGNLIGGVSARYATVSADVSSIFGDGSIGSTGYGVGGSLTWYGNSGFYLDAQANLTWYDSNLSSSTAATSLVSDNNGFGYALGLEAGQQIALGPNWSVTPQAQLIYSAVGYDDFTDPFGAAVSLADADRLKIRLGLSADYQNSWTDDAGQTSRLHAYGIANLYYDILPKTETDLAGVRLTNMQEALWGGLGLGGTYNWGDDKYALHGEAAVNTGLANFANSYDITGTAGFTVRF